MMISCSNDGRAILWNVQQNCEKKNFIIQLFFFFSLVAIFAELDVDNATPLTSIVTLNTQK
jgi:hypothetical protein